MASTFEGLGFRVQGFEFEFRVQDFRIGFRVESFGCRLKGFRV